MEKLLTANGTKAQQRPDDEYRIKPYLQWHRSLGNGMYMLDVDCIEWRFRNGKLVAVGVLEVTRRDGDLPVRAAYLEKIVQRFNSRDMQGKAARMVAEALNTNAYIVLFRYNCQEFFVYNLSDPGPWQRFNDEQFQQFLRSL